MPHGGSRVGAGRKAEPSRKTMTTKDKCNEQFDVRASSALPELFDTMYAIATGYKVGVYEQPRKQATTQAKTVTGEIIFVYTVPPDKQAAQYLIDRAAGKAVTKSAEQTDTELTLEVTLTAPETDDA